MKTTYVPQAELYPALDMEGVNLVGVEHKWRGISLNDARAMVSKPTTVEINGRLINAYIIKPESVDYDPTDAVVRFAEFGQTINAIQQFIGAKITQEVVAPNRQLIMLENNGIGQTEHEFDDVLMESIRKKGLRPYAEDKIRVLEKLGIKRADFTGWSLGARLAIEAVAVGSTEIDVVHVNADEPPSMLGRTAKELRKDFMKSGGWAEQRQAGDDCEARAVAEAFKPARLAIDYAKFGWASLRAHNQVLHDAMAGDISESMASAYNANPDVSIKLGVVEGSRICVPSKKDILGIARQNTTLEYYDDLYYRHGTVNHPILQALIARRGLI